MIVLPVPMQPNFSTQQQTCTHCGKTNTVAGMFEEGQLQGTPNYKVWCGFCGKSFEAGRQVYPPVHLESAPEGVS